MGKVKLSLLVVALLAVAGGVFWYQSRNSTPGTPATTPAVSDKEAQVVEGGNAINVDSQEGGETVLIDLTVLEEEPGFIVIHTATKEMKPGEIVGHSELLAKGQHKDVVVDINPPAKKGETYFAMLHKDNGDGDYGDEDEANTLKDDQGNVVVMKFTITRDPAPEEVE